MPSSQMTWGEMKGKSTCLAMSGGEKRRKERKGKKYNKSRKISQLNSKMSVL